MKNRRLKKWFRNMLLLIGLILIYLASMLSPAMFFGIDATTRKVVVTGHRGAAGLAPENTLVAISKGISFGAERVEIDLQQTADGVVVVMHDEFVDRTTNGTGAVKDLTFAEIKKLDAGEKFSPDFEGERVPSLEEVLQTVNGQCDLVIEIKRGNEYYPKIIEHTVALIKKFNAIDWCIVHSFNMDALIEIHRQMPELRLHRLFVAKFRGLPLVYDGTFSKLDIEKYPWIEEYSIMYQFADKGVIDQLHQHGKKVNVWTVDDQKHINRLINLGVDGIITDRPDLMNK